MGLSRCLNVSPRIQVLFQIVSHCSEMRSIVRLFNTGSIDFVEVYELSHYCVRR